MLSGGGGVLTVTFAGTARVTRVTRSDPPFARERRYPTVDPYALMLGLEQTFQEQFTVAPQEQYASHCT